MCRTLMLFIPICGKRDKFKEYLIIKKNNIYWEVAIYLWYRVRDGCAFIYNPTVFALRGVDEEGGESIYGEYYILIII